MFEWIIGFLNPKQEIIQHGFVVLAKKQKRCASDFYSKHPLVIIMYPETCDYNLIHALNEFVVPIVNTLISVTFNCEKTMAN